MEIGKQQWSSIQTMPLKTLYDYLEWKSKLEEEKAKLIESAKNHNTNNKRL
jgi:hypothetical protein